LNALETRSVIKEVVVKDPVIETISETEIRETGQYCYGINYSAIIPVLVKGMQEQQAMIDDLKKENALLQERMQRIEELLTKNQD